MRRKSERNKAKGSPEKKVEKPTRRTTRRRGKASPSTSPERENVDENVSSTPFSDDDKELRLQSEQQGNDREELRKDVISSELIKSVLGEGEEDNGSVWKVARADASPGEIQKLKLCRQRNISEASDSSISKTKSHKWPDSDEGGAEEADSADEQISSSRKTTIGKQVDDPSSSHPGQDSNEEVSDYKENLPEITSANLSDDKTNIDQLADFKENLSETTATKLSEPPNNEDNKSSSPSTNLPSDNSHSSQSLDCRENVAELTSGKLLNDQQNEDYPENSSTPGLNSISKKSHQLIGSNANPSINDEHSNKVIPADKNVKINQEAITDESTASCGDRTVENVIPVSNELLKQESTLLKEKKTENILISNKTVATDNVDIKRNSRNEEEEEEGEIREDVEKEPSSKVDSSDTQDTQIKYRESSHSDTPESNDESNKIKKKGAQKKEVEKDTSKAEGGKRKGRKEKKSEKQKTTTTEVDKNSVSANAESEIELSECNIEKDDILEISEKSDELNVNLSTSKPIKVSLKRSFSTRLSTDSETKKEENLNKKPISKESNQNKENHADNEQPDQKSSTKRRRWGMTTSTDIAPAFSISTDSLKALVPGAKPLSVNEVRLNKDEDDERESRKSKSENSGDHKSKYDTVSKIDINKKGDSKIDNHITSRRKITVVKETPRPKSPSPPEAQATNILLIRNLVRPFTLNQIKELLSRTGTIVENGFWMDRIKSKCFVEYANEDQAFETRQALHGVSWPLSNPKKLIVDYATKEDMNTTRETSSKDQPVARKVEPTPSGDVWKRFHWSRDEGNNVVNKITVIREWDLGKEDGQMHVKEKEREKKEFEKKKRQRSRSPILEAHLPAPARKFKKKEEEPPTAKLLDDLFRKTKAIPCIYWLPLTNEQIIVKEEMRRQHMAEHARRLEEMRRAERNRDTRRRRSPRK
ncbi:PREDICTED: apoptotic chromatin condensation inducer in the nucleus [Ceratosolen solmsi marchali]|uniref:Apoptotic chromatin condensation inducer in the nucleus n=1 Tax=Ceratosolen solmsi marchali TaxID=326594 RepID=A0AAJ6YXC3_9HYME|nr:PREDICTED: apoptotic chromatin condensation inducer in the nucleus [Ceratosolen solmsi marchali]XP_011506077.1 PREDICTED: apoptotic chromatin condensation inducer in the nucleus [Ceratosolen solmsi marchali]